MTGDKQSAKEMSPEHVTPSALIGALPVPVAGVLQQVTTSTFDWHAFCGVEVLSDSKCLRYCTSSAKAAFSTCKAASGPL